MPAGMYRNVLSYYHAEITAVSITGILIQCKVHGWEAEVGERAFLNSANELRLGRSNGLVTPSTSLDKTTVAFSFFFILILPWFWHKREIKICQNITASSLPRSFYEYAVFCPNVDINIPRPKLSPHSSSL